MVPLGATQICVDTEGGILFNAFHVVSARATSSSKKQ